MALDPCHVFVATSQTEADPTSNDPFTDHSTPRHDRGSLAALVAAIQQVVPPSPNMPGSRSKTCNNNSMPRRGQCTHITMNRLHDENACQMCGKVPDMRWLYACRQDWLVEHQSDFAGTVSESDIAPDETNYFDVMARFAFSIRMSASVVKQIRDGLYTYDQVEKLIAQKEHLNKTIEEIFDSSTDGTPASSLNLSQSCTNIIAPLGLSGTSSTTNQEQSDVPPSTLTTAQQSSAKKNGNSVTTKKQPQMRPDHCNYMICHTCRPFLHDRLYANIGSVIHGGVYPPVTPEEAKTLPTEDAAVVRSLGLRQTTPATITSPRRLQRSNSVDDVLTPAREYEDDTPLEWTTTSNSSSFFDDDPQELRTFDPYPCPGPGVCPVYSRNSGCAYDAHDFDDGQRALNHGYGSTEAMGKTNKVSQMTPDRSRTRHHRLGSSVSGTPGRSSSSASSISLPTPTTLPLSRDRPIFRRLDYDNSNKIGKAASTCGVLSPGMNINTARLSVGSDLSGRSSNSSFGSELEVEGGVALKEEAVETGLPDILT